MEAIKQTFQRCKAQNRVSNCPATSGWRPCLSATPTETIDSC